MIGNDFHIIFNVLLKLLRNINKKNGCNAIFFVYDYREGRERSPLLPETMKSQSRFWGFAAVYRRSPQYSSLHSKKMLQRLLISSVLFHVILTISDLNKQFFVIPLEAVEECSIIHVMYSRYWTYCFQLNIDYYIKSTLV